jgi:hypothetical protein
MRKLLTLATVLVAAVAFPAALQLRECPRQLAPHVGFAVVHG